MDVPKDENPEILSTFTSTAFGFLSSYGWHLLFFAVTANLIWSAIRPSLRKWQERRREQQLEAEYNQNPERLIALQEGLERSRLRLQEELDRKAREYAEKMKKVEEEKREEKIKKWECVQKGSSSKTSDEDASQPAADPSMRPNIDKGARLRGNDYNPLMGSGGSSGFRRSRNLGNRGGG